MFKQQVRLYAREKGRLSDSQNQDAKQNDWLSLNRQTACIKPQNEACTCRVPETDKQITRGDVAPSTALSSLQLEGYGGQLLALGLGNQQLDL